MFDNTTKTIVVVVFKLKTKTKATVGSGPITKEEKINPKNLLTRSNFEVKGLS